MKPATKDVARAFLRAVSPFVATCPAIKPRVTSTRQAKIKSPKRLPARSPGSNKNNEIRQKIRPPDKFLPTANSSPSKKVTETKDTIR